MMTSSVHKEVTNMNIEAFIEALGKQGIILSERQLEQFEIYHRMLVEWNEKMNLTNILEKEDVYLKHFYDSLTLAFYHPLKDETLCDIGAGAGFPSIPLKIVFPDIKVTIVDSLNKRITFLNALFEALDLVNVQAVCARAEEYCKEHREAFDIVTARAVARFEILDELKKEEISSKVLMLTAKNTIDDKMTCFNNGADDYLTKPFHMQELIARVNIQLRKSKTKNNNIMELGDIILNIKSMELCNRNENYKVKIIGKEFQLLELLMNNPNQVILKEQLFVKIWGYDTESDINTLEAYISFIRKKLKLIKSKINLKAIRNMGYVLEVFDEKVKK